MPNICSKAKKHSFLKDVRGTLVAAHPTSRMRGHRFAPNFLKKLEWHKDVSIKENIEITSTFFCLLKGFCNNGRCLKTL